MRSSSFFSRSSFVKLLSLLPLISAQSVPNGVLREGNGAPGVAPYQLVDNYKPDGFFDQFNFFTAGDLTNGHVQYVDRATAERQSVVTTTNGAARLSVDTTNKFPLGGRGRPSVRLISNNAYSHGLFIADVKHMPRGCGTWPAYWLLGLDPWPKFGEIGK
jgi:beta-glucanase (GH16 family)